MHWKLENEDRDRSKPLVVGRWRRRIRRPCTGILGAWIAALWLCAGCTPGLPTPNCDHDGDGYCSEAVGNMPGGDCCDQLGDVGCGDATQPETIFPEAPETCADIGIDNDCDGDADEVDGLGDVCDTGVCPIQPCPCSFGHVECEAGESVCIPEFESEDEECDGVDQNCNGIEDSADMIAHTSCEDASGIGYYCVVDTCVEGCLLAHDCGDRGNLCDIASGDTFGMCKCGEDNACSNNFVCDRLLDEPFGYACLCGNNTTECGINEGCSVDGNCTCGDIENDTNGLVEACNDPSAPDCILVPTPHCDCAGAIEPCEPNESCCDGHCVDTNEDPNYCGSCHNSCDDGSLCCSGRCSHVTACPLE